MATRDMDVAARGAQIRRVALVVLHVARTLEPGQVVLTFEPPWTKDMMTEEAKLELGFL